MGLPTSRKHDGAIFNGLLVAANITLFILDLTLLMSGFRNLMVGWYEEASASAPASATASATAIGNSNEAKDWKSAVAELLL